MAIYFRFVPNNYNQAPNHSHHFMEEDGGQWRQPAVAAAVVIGIIAFHTKNEIFRRFKRVLNVKQHTYRRQRNRGSKRRGLTSLYLLGKHMWTKSVKGSAPVVAGNHSPASKHPARAIHSHATLPSSSLRCFDATERGFKGGIVVVLSTYSEDEERMRKPHSGLLNSTFRWWRNWRPTMASERVTAGVAGCRRLIMH